jgi:hypothetical protein
MYPAHRHMCIVKANYLSALYKKESYVLEFDEAHFRFTNTGQRMPFELLVKGQDVDDSKAKYEQAKELKEAGKNYNEIAEMLGFASKSSVARLFEKAKKMGWHEMDIDSENME